jgi:arylsulfatase A-like enzyme
MPVATHKEKEGDLSLRQASAPLAALALTGALSIAAPQVSAREGSSLRRPNVLVFVTDDQRAGTVKHMDATRRWFARRGTTFAKTFATTAVCCPSRASIFTGRYAHNHGVLTNQEGQANNLDQSTTVQRHLDHAGYRTGLIGKFLNHWDLSRPPPHFDDYVLFDRGYYGRPFNVNGTIRIVSSYTTDFIRRQAKRFLGNAEQFDRRPWFLYVAPWAPHTPATPEPTYERAFVPPLSPNPAMLEGDRSDKPAYVQEDPTDITKAARNRRRQLRTLMSVDDLVDGVMKKVMRLGEGANTLAIFLSDNGVGWEEHGLSGKAVPYFSTIRIPLYTRWPGHIPAKRRDRRIAANIDVAPTILDAAGIPAHAGLDGRSLLRRWRRNRLLLEAFGSDVRPDIKWAATLTARKQYVEYYAGESAAPTFREYYDLSNDPWQLRNLLGDEQRVNDPNLDYLSARLTTDRRCRGSRCP